MYWHEVFSFWKLYVSSLQPYLKRLLDECQHVTHSAWSGPIYFLILTKVLNKQNKNLKEKVIKQNPILLHVWVFIICKSCAVTNTYNYILSQKKICKLKNILILVLLSLYQIKTNFFSYILSNFKIKHDVTSGWLRTLYTVRNHKTCALCRDSIY